MRGVDARLVSVGLVTALALFDVAHPPTLAAQGTQPRASSPSVPSYVAWPLSSSGAQYRDIDGKRLWQYVQDQADIARRYRDQGHPQFWGRIAGTSGDVEAADWLLAKFRDLGLSDTRIQSIVFFHPQWAPRSWEVTITAGGNTVALTSAQPPYGSPSTDGKVLDLPAAYVGLGSDADFAGRDVRGKAVFVIQGDGVGDAQKRAQDNGAAAVFSVDPRGGNLSYQDYRATTTIQNFNLGTEDGNTVRDLITKSSAANPPRVRIRLDAEWDPNQKSYLVWGSLPGTTEETIYIIGHRDGWFDAAGDNASGIATMLGLAEHFAKMPQSQRRRTIIFIGTDGHHQNNPGGYGREWLAANREKFFTKTALMINAEHPAEVLTHGSAGWTESVIPNAWYGGGPTRPNLTKITADAFHEFGLPIWAEPGENPPAGDIGPFVPFVPGVVAQSNDFFYFHTTGDTPENVVWTGLEAATRAYAKIIDEVNKLPLSELQRLPGAYRPRLDLSNCAAWIADSSKGCTPTPNRD
jgi:hypothetical protein